MQPEYKLAGRGRRLDGKTHMVSAASLGVSPQTVNYRIGQTVRLLREELKDYWPLIV